MARPPVIVLGVVFLLVVPSVSSQEATSSRYRQEILDRPDGNPSLQLTNTSGSPIIAYVVAWSPYEDGRIGVLGYHDSCTIRGDQSIVSGASVTYPAGHYVNSQFKMERTEVPAVVFGDGSTAGDSSWIDFLLARRLRLYDRLISLRDLLKPQIGTGASLSEVIEKLQSAQTAQEQLPDDELRDVDGVALGSAIRTMQAYSGRSSVDVANLLQVYVKHLEAQTAQISRCQPTLETVRVRLANRPNPGQPIRPARLAD